MKKFCISGVLVRYNNFVLLFLFELMHFSSIRLENIDLAHLTQNFEIIHGMFLGFLLPLRK
jgi:hypothetical protein